ncbi:MAG: bifunctional folylpolyglutamate synthase/dihydrofolate synthase [Pirellulaceae bacterium]|nr:bifunctional folylpolyglutamate synthase/dihydrofolate synthase [Pirellulaceae bacterium]
MTNRSARHVPQDYAAALCMLYERINYEKQNHAAPYTSQHYRLDRMRELLACLGHPDRQYPIIHIAGTKGKGTTATLLHDALSTAGWRVGLYTSPHLVRLEERFRVNGNQCSPEELVGLTGQVIDAAHQLENAGWERPTFFELTTAMGMLYFAQQQVNCTVLEVGLGGRLDSTNVCQPILSVITSISLDHQTQLGETISQIAGEKAGIIKPRVPVISTARHPDARQIIERVAAAHESPLMLLERDFSVHWQATSFMPPTSMENSSGPVAEVVYRTLTEGRSSPLANTKWRTRMLGRHQADNLAGAITALDWMLSDAGYHFEFDALRSGIASSHAPARLQIVGRSPLRLIDTAHNPVSIAAALQALDDHFPNQPRTIVFACSRDKDYRDMLRQILPNCQRLICTRFLENPRAVSPEQLRQIAAEFYDQATNNSVNKDQRRPTIEQADNPCAAWRRALQTAGQNGLIIAMGSFFLAAELMAQPLQGDSTECNMLHSQPQGM